MSETKTKVVKEGDCVVLQSQDGKFAFVQNVSASSKCAFKKKEGQFSLQPLLGKPYFCFYELNKQLKALVGPLTYNPAAESVLGTEEQQLQLQPDELCEVHGDNRSLVDNNQSQTLSAQEIEQMKKENIEGMQIIAAIIGGSATFQAKTQLSQEKYIERKKKKFVKFVRVLEPTSAVICEAYFQKNPDKIGFIRVDAFSQLLTRGNIYPHTQVLLFDTCMGLVTAGVVERQGVGQGRVIRVYEDGKLSSHMHALQLMNIPQHYKKAAQKSDDLAAMPIIHVPLSLFAKLQHSNQADHNQQQQEQKQHPELEHPEPKQQQQVQHNEQQQQEVQHNEQQQEVQRNEQEVQHNEQQQQVQHNGQQQPAQSLPSGSDQIVLGQFVKHHLSDCLVIATRSHDHDILLETLLPFLQPSGTFVLFSPYFKQLETVFLRLKQLPRDHPYKILDLNLSETWLREHQVLPLRTHPVMRMRAASGYILSGIKVLNN